MSGVTDLMLALLSPDPGTRTQAEAQVNNVRDTDFPSFVTYLIAEMRDGDAPADSRRMAGLLLKNNIALKLRDVDAREALENRWKALDGALRQQVKNEVLATLASSEHEVRYVAASIVGNLARIELPFGEWPDLLESLVNAATGADEQFQEAALTALGYIAEETNTSEELEEHLSNYSTQILNAVVSGMSSASANVRFYAAAALNNAMEFCDANMKDDEQRNFLIGIVCSTIAEGEERTRQAAMQALVKVAECYYEYLPEYISQLFEITSDVITKGTSEEIALQGFLFWITICDVEREMLENNSKGCHSFARMGNQQLCDLVQWALVQQEEGQSEDDWNVSIAAGKLLQTLAETIQGDILTTMMPWIYENINSDDWHRCEGALMAFGCIMSGPEPGEMCDLVSQALPNGLFKYVQHGHELIADTAGWALSIAAELFPTTILSIPNNLSQLLAIVGPMLAGKSTGMAIRAANIISNLAAYYEDEETLPSCELSPYFEDICRGLIVAMDRTDGGPKLRGQVQEALNVVVDSAPDDALNTLCALVPEIQNRLQQTFQMVAQGYSETDMHLAQGLFCGTLNGLARKLKRGIAGHAPGIINQMQQVFEQSDATVQDEALLCVGALAHSLGNAFAGYVPQLIPYLLLGLRNTDEFDLCNVAVGVVGDFVSNVGPRLLECGADDIMNAILDGLRDPAVHRDLKCVFLSCLGDVALNLGPAFARYLDGFMAIVWEMDASSRQLDIANDPELEEYALDLWEAMLSFFTGVAQCFKTDITALKPHIPHMLDFAIFVAPAARKSEDVFSAALGVIGDVANVVSEQDTATIVEAKGFLLVDAVYNTVKEGLRSDDKETKENARWVQRQIQAIESVH